MYEIDNAYREGALARRKWIPWASDRYPDSEEKSDQWSYGHTNEDAGCHTVDGIDVITAAPSGSTFENRTLEGTT